MGNIRCTVITVDFFFFFSFRVRFIGEFRLTLKDADSSKLTLFGMIAICYRNRIECANAWEIDFS